MRREKKQNGVKKHNPLSINSINEDYGSLDYDDESQDYPQQSAKSIALSPEVAYTNVLDFNFDPNQQLRKYLSYGSCLIFGSLATIFYYFSSTNYNAKNNVSPDLAFTTYYESMGANFFPNVGFFFKLVMVLYRNQKLRPSLEALGAKYPGIGTIMLAGLFTLISVIPMHVAAVFFGCLLWSVIINNVTTFTQHLYTFINTPLIAKVKSIFSCTRCRKDYTPEDEKYDQKFMGFLNKRSDFALKKLLEDLALNKNDIRNNLKKKYPALHSLLLKHEIKLTDDHENEEERNEDNISKEQAMREFYQYAFSPEVSQAFSNHKPYKSKLMYYLFMLAIGPFALFAYDAACVSILPGPTSWNSPKMSFNTTSAFNTTNELYGLQGPPYNLNASLAVPLGATLAVLGLIIFTYLNCYEAGEVGYKLSEEIKNLFTREEIPYSKSLERLLYPGTFYTMATFGVSTAAYSCITSLGLEVFMLPVLNLMLGWTSAPWLITGAYWYALVVGVGIGTAVFNGSQTDVIAKFFVNVMNLMATSCGWADPQKSMLLNFQANMKNQLSATTRMQRGKLFDVLGGDLDQQLDTAYQKSLQTDSQEDKVEQKSKNHISENHVLENHIEDAGAEGISEAASSAAPTQSTWLSRVPFWGYFTGQTTTDRTPLIIGEPSFRSSDDDAYDGAALA